MGDKHFPVEKTDQEWQQTLTPNQFDVLRQHGTERAGTSQLNHEKRSGTFVCAGCGQPLFSSDTKFESGTGWPSFTKPIAGHMATRRDFKMILPRTEYHCARCEGHQGHVFNDGPLPRRERWCNNGLALRFVSKDEQLPPLRS